MQPEKRYEKVWYGYQPLIADAISISLFLGGAASTTDGVTTAGYLGFILGTPIIHMAHGNIGKGFGSLGLRVGVPLTAAAIGAISGLIIASRSGDRDEAAGTGAIIGASIGVAGCVVIDAAGFAYTKELVEERAVTTARPRPTFTLAPSVDVRKDRAAIGIVGQF